MAGVGLSLPGLLAWEPWSSVVPSAVEVLGSIRASTHNGSVFALLEQIFEPGDWLAWTGWLIAALSALLAVVLLIRRGNSIAMTLYVSTMAALLLGPTARISLLVWPLAMVPMLLGRAGISAIVWAGSAALTIMNADLDRALWPQYLPVYLALVAELVAHRIRSSRQARQAEDSNPPRTLATVNAAGTVAAEASPPGQGGADVE